MTSPYITAALERADLPISVGTLDHPYGVLMVVSGGPHNYALFDPAEASRAYLTLCESLSKPGASIPPGTSDGCSASSIAPVGAGL